MAISVQTTCDNGSVLRGWSFSRSRKALLLVGMVSKRFGLIGLCSRCKPLGKPLQVDEVGLSLLRKNCLEFQVLLFTRTDPETDEELPWQLYTI